MNTDAALDPHDAPAPPARWSRMAMASLVLSVLPVGSLLAPLLGLVALIRMRGNPGLRGRGLAWGGIGLGLVASALMVGSAYVMYRAFMEVAGRPVAALEAAWAGDTERFRMQMTRPGSEATDTQLAAWVAPLRARLGTLESVEMDAKAPADPGTPQKERDMRAAYVATVRKDGQVSRVPVEVIFDRPAGVGAVAAILVRSFTFSLPDGTRIVFPEDERPDAPKPTDPSAERP